MCAIQDVVPEEKKNSESEVNCIPQNNNFKSTLTQCVAGLAASISTLSIGMMISIPTIVIGKLHNGQSHEDFSINDYEASWFGSLLYLIEPGCSLFGAILQPYIGRKYGLIGTLIPQLFAWVTLSMAQSIEALLLSAILFGISAGSAEAPGLAYIGEISEPRLRGILAGYFNGSVYVGLIVEFLLSSIFCWRTTAAISVAPSIFGILIICLIPESPIWLLYRGRKEDALKSLCQLRGWVNEDAVKLEFQGMCHYVENSKIPPNSSEIGSASTSHSLKARWMKLISSVLRPRMRQPLLLLTVCHTAYHSVTLTGMRSYFMEILSALQVVLDPSLFMFMNSILAVGGVVICLTMVRFAGKRVLLLMSLVTCSLICTLLSAYVFLIHQTGVRLGLIPSVLMGILHLVLSIGIGPIPWMLTSEIFSAGDRSLGAGLAAALFYVIGFLFSKTYYNLCEIIHLSGCFTLYGVIGLVIFVYLYKYLPETEGKTLAEVEEYFSKQSRKPVIDNT